MSRTAVFEARLTRARSRVLDALDEVGAAELAGRSATPEMQMRLEESVSDLARLEQLASSADHFSPYRSAGARTTFFFDSVRAAHDKADSATLARLDLQHRSGVLDGLTPSVYLVDEFAELSPGARPLTDLLSRPAPEEGVSVTVGRATTAASAEAQDGENAAPTQSTITIEAEELPLAVAHGGLYVSNQLLRRAPDGAALVVTREVGGAWAGRCEQLVINGSGENGEPVGLLSTEDIGEVTHTDDSATAAGFLDKVAAAAALSATGRGLPPDTLVVHPRRWFYLLGTAGTDTVGRLSSIPRPGAPPQAIGQACGLDVIASPGVPTDLGTGEDEDIAIVLRAADVPVLETPVEVNVRYAPNDVKAPELSSWAGVSSLLVVLGWDHPEGIVTIGGTGMAATLESDDEELD